MYRIILECYGVPRQKARNRRATSPKRFGFILRTNRCPMHFCGYGAPRMTGDLKLVSVERFPEIACIGWG